MSRWREFPRYAPVLPLMRPTNVLALGIIFYVLRVLLLSSTAHLMLNDFTEVINHSFNHPNLTAVFILDRLLVLTEHDFTT